MAIYPTPGQKNDDRELSDRQEILADAERVRPAGAEDENSAPVFRDYGSYI